jgi:hypothetical protein
MIAKECSTEGGDEKYTKIFVGKLQRKDHFRDPGVCGRIILKEI